MFTPVVLAVSAIVAVAVLALWPGARIPRTIKSLLRYLVRTERGRRYLGLPAILAPDASLRAITKLVGAWTTATFVEAGGRGAANHLIDEAKEVLEEIERILAAGVMTPEMKYKLALELADCLILVMDIAFSKEIDLTDSVLLKHHINTLRKWSKPDKNGIQKHIEEPVKGDISRTEEELKRLKANWRVGDEKLAAIIARPDPTIAAAMSELLNEDERLEGFEA